jgi:hypothetical protein
MLAKVGKAEGDILPFTNADHRRNADGAMELLDLWDHHATLFLADIKDTIANMLSAGEGDVERCVDQALIAATNQLESVEPEVSSSKESDNVSYFLHLFPHA